jgi:signal transduction histidine kinase
MIAARISTAIDNALLYEDAQQAVRARDEFLSIASHELKTPLTPLRLQIQKLRYLIRRGEPAAVSPEQILAAVEKSDRQIARVVALVEDLLDISRITAGRLTLHVEPVDVAALIRDVVERFAPSLADAGCTPDLSLPPDVTIQADRIRLDQVVVNLITNAIKYAPGAPLRIRLRRESDGGARLEVQDQGPGIAAADQERIFTRFERAVADVNKVGGLGLGLYISRQIAHAHGGDLVVQSTPGTGATFVVVLPAAPPVPQRDERAPLTPPDGQETAA